MFYNGSVKEPIFMDCTNDNTRYEERLAALARSNFRSRFHLALRDRQYICDKGWDVMLPPRRRLCRAAPCSGGYPERRQADPDARPPVFIAQHATACCCRRVSGKVARHPGGTRADGRRTALYRRSASLLDAARNDLAPARPSAVTRRVFVQSAQKSRDFSAHLPSDFSCKPFPGLLQ